MDFYYFGGFIGDQSVKTIEDHKFKGILFTYDIGQGDFFTRIARDIDTRQNIKYMVAIRPHTISPQYLSMIHQGMNTVMPDRLQINLISGHIKPHEKNVGGIIGDVNDLSSNIDRSNYLIKYLYEMDQMKKNNPDYLLPDFYVSVSNEYVFDAASKLNNKMIIQYKQYNEGCWTHYENYQTDNQKMSMGNKFSVQGKNVMISVAPILRKTKKEIDDLPKIMHTTDTAYFTYNEFELWIENVKRDGINELMLISWPTEEREYVKDFVKQYKIKELATQ